MEVPDFCTPSLRQTDCQPDRYALPNDTRKQKWLDMEGSILYKYNLE